VNMPDDMREPSVLDAESISGPALDDRAEPNPFADGITLNVA